MWQNSHSFLLEKTESRFWKMCLSILSFHTRPRWAWIREATLQRRIRQSPFQLPPCPPIPSRRRHSPMALQWASHQVSTIPSPLSGWWSLTGTSTPTSSVPTPSLKTPRGEHQIPPSQRLSRRACKRYQEWQSLCVYASWSGWRDPVSSLIFLAMWARNVSSDWGIEDFLKKMHDWVNKTFTIWNSYQKQMTNLTSDRAFGLQSVEIVILIHSAVLGFARVRHSMVPLRVLK